MSIDPKVLDSIFLNVWELTEAGRLEWAMYVNFLSLASISGRKISPNTYTATLGDFTFRLSYDSLDIEKSGELMGSVEHLSGAFQENDVHGLYDLAREKVLHVGDNLEALNSLLKDLRHKDLPKNPSSKNRDSERK
jgi:hypothetical protein